MSSRDAILVTAWCAILSAVLVVLIVRLVQLVCVAWVVSHG